MMLFYRGLENEEHLAFLFHWSLANQEIHRRES